MAIVEDGNAPYAPPAAVIEVIRRYRDRGLQKPFTLDVLMKAGVTESLAPRTLQTFRLLDLIDEDGNPTTAFEGIRKAYDEDYPGLLADVIRAAYAEVFQFTDPATEPAERVADAFRSYTPAGQRPRMVTLFLGLCQEARIVTQEPPKARAAAKPTRAPKRKRHAPRDKSSASEEQRKPRPPDGLTFGVTDEDIAALTDEEFQEVWAALGTVARARSRPKSTLKQTDPDKDGDG